MKDWKMIVWLVLGSAFLVLMMIFGLTKLGGNVEGIKVDEAELLSGARFSNGVKDAKVRVVVFSDMECPACKRAEGMLKKVSQTPGVSYVLRHFPLTVHKHSKNGAYAAEAALEMGKGWEMVDALFEKQEEWSAAKDVDAKLISIAVEIGLDEKEFKLRFVSDEVRKKAKIDSDLADRLLLNGTPTVFVNGEQVAVDFVEGKVNELLATK